MLFLMSSTWCPLPWNFQAIRNNGDLRICCQANISTSRGILRDQNENIFNAKSCDLKQSRNSPLLKEVRQAMLAGRWSDHCVRCQNEESAGLRSRRNYENEIWQNQINEARAREYTAADGSIPTEKFPVHYYDLRFGNLCNLKCRMCTATDSSAWYSDYVKMYGSAFQDTHGTVNLVVNKKGKLVPVNDDYGWHSSEAFWKQLYENIPQIQHLHIVGGEPFLIQRHFDFLDTIAQQGYSQNVILEYNSNITIIPERAWDIWRKFKQVRIGASIDGVGRVNEYIRYPSRWEKILANLLLLDQSPKNFRIWISATIQIYNILHLPDFLKWRLEMDFQRIHRNSQHPLLISHALHHPPFLNIRALPPQAKILVQEKLQGFLLWLESWLTQKKLSLELETRYRNSATKMLHGYIQYMNSADWSHMVPEFLAYTKKLDDLRLQRFTDIYPDLGEIIFSHRPKYSKAEKELMQH